MGVTAGRSKHQAQSDIRFLRRLMRDIKTRGRSVESVIEQYMTTVRPMHEEFVEPSKRHASIFDGVRSGSSSP